MKKKLVLISALFLLTGCSATYEIEIYDDTINEKIDITDSTSSSAIEVKEKIYNIFETKVGGVDELARNFQPYSDKKNNYYSIRENSTFKIEDYKNEVANITDCCRSIELSDDGDYIVFRTLGYFKWFEQYEDLDELTIRIKSNHKLVETNADEIHRYSYTWIINKDNYKEKIPYIKLYSDKYVFNYNNEFVKKVLPIVVITGIILGGSGITYFYLKKKNSKINEI